MNIFLVNVAILSTTLMVFQLHAQAHEQGQLFIAPEGRRWHTKLRIPGADASASVHKTKKTAEKPAQIHTTCRPNNNIQLPKMYEQCSLKSASHPLTENAGDSYKKHHENSAEHNKGPYEEDSHRDVLAQYQFRCDGEVTAISAMVFESMPSVSATQAQWVTTQGPGDRELRPDQPILKW